MGIAQIRIHLFIMMFLRNFVIKLIVIKINSVSLT